jgi:hypothetical protein
MADATFEEVVAQALSLSPAEQAMLMGRLAAALHDNLMTTSSKGDTSEWTNEEWAAMLKPEPLSPTEVIARGFTGTWTGISDGAERVNQRKHKREAERQWKFRSP